MKPYRTKETEETDTIERELNLQVENLNLSLQEIEFETSNLK